MISTLPAVLKLGFFCLNWPSLKKVTANRSSLVGVELTGHIWAPNPLVFVGADVCPEVSEVSE